MSELMYTTHLFALQKQINIVLGSTSTFIGLILLTLVVIGYTANSRRSMVIGFLSVILGLFLFSKGLLFLVVVISVLTLVVVVNPAHLTGRMIFLPWNTLKVFGDIG